MTKAATRILVLVGFVLSASFAHGQLTKKWSADYNYGNHDTDEGLKVVLSPSGFSYVLGVASPGIGISYFELVKYNTQGTRDWSRVINGTQGSDAPKDIKLASDGSIYLCGATSVAGGHSDLVVYKYDPSGTQTWKTTYRLSSEDEDGALAMQVDSNDNVYVTGFDIPNSGKTDALTMKISKAGSIAWVARHNSTSNGNDQDNYGYYIAVDSNNNSYVLCTDGGADGADNVDLTIVKYSPSGVPLWSQGPGINPASARWPRGLELAPGGGVYAVGIAYNLGNRSIFAVRFDTDGNIVYRTTLESFGSQVVGGTATDNSGRLVINGGDAGLMETFKIDTSGNLMWSTLSQDMEGAEVMVDEKGYIYALGLPPRLSINAFCLLEKLTKDGDVIWSTKQDQVFTSWFDILPNGVLVSTGSDAAHEDTHTIGYKQNPMALDDSYTVGTNHTLTAGSAAGVLSNDLYCSGGGVTLVHGPNHGTLTLHVDGGFVYIPDSGFIGLDTFTYKAELSGQVSTAATATITVRPNLTGFTASETDITGGVPTVGIVTVSGPAPQGGTDIQISSASAAISVPSTVTVAAGDSSVDFVIETSAVNAPAVRTVTATLGSTVKTLSLTLEPVLALQSLSLNPTTVHGGSSTIGTVTLNRAAPSGGIVVTLSSNSSVVKPPASVTVGVGQTSATFVVQTLAVGATYTRQVSATYNGVTKTANLTLIP